MQHRFALDGENAAVDCGRSTNRLKDEVGGKNHDDREAVDYADDVLLSAALQHILRAWRCVMVCWFFWVLALKVCPRQDVKRTDSPVMREEAIVRLRRAKPPSV
jgi:hypothetical protein